MDDKTNFEKAPLQKETSVAGSEVDHKSFLSATSIAHTDSPALPFTPGSRLVIHARGMPVIRLPLPSRELTITVTHPDGTPAYLSTRPRVSSGSCTLSSAATGEALIETGYKFGPGRPPTVRILAAGAPPPNYDGSVTDGGVIDETFEMRSKGLLTRTILFTSARWEEFEWSYAHETREGEGKVNLLVLTKVSPPHNYYGQDGSKGKETQAPGRKVKIAELVRSEGTRTQGSGKCSAGNGGLLVIGDGVLGLEIDEPLVVATCLIMLKKELDRRRMAQLAAIGAAASGGG